MVTARLLQFGLVVVIHFVASWILLPTVAILVVFGGGWVGIPIFLLFWFPLAGFLSASEALGYDFTLGECSLSQLAIALFLTSVVWTLVVYPAWLLLRRSSIRGHGVDQHGVLTSPARQQYRDQHSGVLQGSSPDSSFLEKETRCTE